MTMILGVERLPVLGMIDLLREAQRLASDINQAMAFVAISPGVLDRIHLLKMVSLCIRSRSVGEECRFLIDTNPISEFKFSIKSCSFFMAFGISVVRLMSCWIIEYSRAERTAIVDNQCRERGLASTYVRRILSTMCCLKC
jgi:hypothetical protein